MLLYIGSKEERQILREDFARFDVIVTSYEMVLRDLEFLAKIRWLNLVFVLAPSLLLSVSCVCVCG